MFKEVPAVVGKESTNGSVGLGLSPGRGRGMPLTPNWNGRWGSAYRRSAQAHGSRLLL